jgi:peptide/nickel transport system ATP-binding protein
MRDPNTLLDLVGIGKTYASRRRTFYGLGPKRRLRALDDVTLRIGRGEIVGLVGESGSGKSTLGRLIVGLEQPDEGTIAFSPALTKAARLEENGLGALMVFQNPTGSLNPRQRVREVIAEPLRVHLPGADIPARVTELMAQVGLSMDFAERRPHELSGGQAQRVGIARALALDPQLLVCDEPISALDVSIQAQVLNLFADLQDRTGCSYLFISHDLPVVERLSHRVAIMYLGRIVETADTAELFERPHHPYTRALIESAPRLEAKKRNFLPVKGEIPSPLDPPPGCHFHPRCPFAFDRCRVERPILREIADGHRSACHLDP